MWETMVEHFQNNPLTSIWRASNEIDSCHTINLRILKRNYLYAYHVTPVDPARLSCQSGNSQLDLRKQYFNFNFMNRPRNFYENWSSEFPLHSYIGHQKPSYPKATMVSQKFSKNVWAGVDDSNNIVHYFLPHCLDGATFWNSLIIDTIQGLSGFGMTRTSQSSGEDEEVLWPGPHGLKKLPQSTFTCSVQLRG